MASIVAWSRPSLKFGTDSRGSTRLLYEWMKEYYDLRAPYYDDWWIGAARDRPGWAEEIEDAMVTVASLPAARTLDIACGTGYLTQHLPGDVVGLDQSESLLAAERRR